MTTEIEAREECKRRGLDPDDYAADGILVWMVVDKEMREGAAPPDTRGERVAIPRARNDGLGWRIDYQWLEKAADQIEKLCGYRITLECLEEAVLLTESLLSAPSPSPTVREPQRHKVMTPEEYETSNIQGWHSVCRDFDNAGNVAVCYGTGCPPYPDGPDRCAGCLHYQDPKRNTECSYAASPNPTLHERGGPVAWRYKHSSWRTWKYEGTKPEGPSIHLFEVEPLYAAPSPSPAETIDDKDLAITGLNKDWNRLRQALDEIVALHDAAFQPATRLLARAIKIAEKALAFTAPESGSTDIGSYIDANTEDR